MYFFVINKVEGDSRVNKKLHLFIFLNIFTSITVLTAREAAVSIINSRRINMSFGLSKTKRLFLI